MGILDEDVERVRSAANLHDIASQRMALRRVGRRFSGLCPFHPEKSPSFSINAEQGLYYCFGCQAKGDVITFVREIEHLDFQGAIEWIANRTGIQLRYSDAHEGESRKKKAKLVDAMGKAIEWYHDQFRSSPDAGAARSYLRERGFTTQEFLDYKIGWAPDEWDSLSKALRLPNDVLSDAGLGFVNRRGRPQDSFRARVLFPIFDAQGDPVAIGGRVMPGGEGPKYKNSPETALYTKSRTLYGLNWHKAAIVDADEVVVCEGYTDVIGFARAGVPRAVATCGTALTEDHVRQLKRFAKRVVLAFDADSAGLAAADRFYAWEKQYEVDVAVAVMPAGKDPGELSVSNPEMLADAVKNAKPFLGFRVDRVLGAANLSNPEGRAKAAELALDAIREHPSDFVRDQYLMQVSGRCGIDLDRLRSSIRSSSGRAIRIAAPATRPDAHDGPELEALRTAVHHPAEMAGFIVPSLFDNELYATACHWLFSNPSLTEALDNADPESVELLSRLAVEEAHSEPVDAATRLIEECSRRQLRVLESEAQRADDPMMYSPTLAWLKLRIMELRNPLVSDVSRQALLAWLSEKADEQPVGA